MENLRRRARPERSDGRFCLQGERTAHGKRVGPCSLTDPGINLDDSSSPRGYLPYVVASQPNSDYHFSKVFVMKHTKWVRAAFAAFVSVARSARHSELATPQNGEMSARKSAWIGLVKVTISYNQPQRPRRSWRGPHGSI